MVSRNAYAAPLSATAVDFNTWCVAVRPGIRQGKAAEAGYCKPVQGAPPIRGRVATGPAGSRPSVHVVRSSDRDGIVLSVGGSVPAGGHVRRYYRGVASPGLHTALLMRQALRDQGIRVGGLNRADYDPPPGAHALVSLQGQALRQLLPRMLAFSNNFMADMLTLDLAVHQGQSPPLDLEKAARALMIPQARSSGTEQTRTPPVLLSGSGLSVGSRISAADVVVLLAGMYGRRALFPAFIGAMTVPEYSPFAFLNDSPGLWSTHTTIKSGILHEPVTVVALAGYVRLPGGDWGAFAILLNGTAEQPELDIQNAVNAVYADMNGLLSSKAQR